MKKIKLEFIKYQACGNDFILKDERDGITIPDGKKPKLVKKLCDRNFGIGADGILFVEPSNRADAKMRLFDREDREALMCGNGIRCVADYLYNELKKDRLLIDTNDGVKEITRVDENLYKVNMGRLRYLMKEVKKLFRGNFPDNEKLLDKEISFPRLGKVRASIVSTGEPHTVIFIEDVEKEDVNKYGKNITKNFKLFPYGVNTDLCQIIDDETIKVRTYEAGVCYETMACGTGATACAAVAYLTGRVKKNKVKVIAHGGEMIIEVEKDAVLMTGPAYPVFNGEVYAEV